MSLLFRRAPRLSSLAAIVLGIALTGCYTKLGTVASSESSPEQTVTDASAITEAPTSSDGADHTQSASTDARDDVDDFFQDFDHYALKHLDASDRALVRQATRLLKERADTEISQSAYRDRLNNFRTEHPDFYGNFFGDPFYATYDLRYTRLAELRQRINTFINPQNSIRNTASFYCNPLTYDPAFNGRCRGFTFAASDFFLLPSGPGFGQQDLPSAQGHDRILTTRRDIGLYPRSVDPGPRQPDTSRTPDTPRPTPGHSGAERASANAQVTKTLSSAPVARARSLEPVLIHATRRQAAAMACKSGPDSGSRSTSALDHVPIFGTSVLVLADRSKIKTGSQTGRPRRSTCPTMYITRCGKSPRRWSKRRQFSESGGKLTGDVNGDGFPFGSVRGSPNGSRRRTAGTS
ncbi:hypothetical protein GGP50_002042 [Salinibacter ruber]|nr:hypothetical protein [Salinibacter ruber]